MAKTKRKTKAKPKKAKVKYKKNPLLMKVNPNATKKDYERIEKMWQCAKRENPNLSRKEFNAAINQYLIQHYVLPDSFSIEDMPVDSKKIKIVVDVGEMPHILYEANSKSRKSAEGPTRYIHETKGTSLVTTPDGKEFFIITKKMKVKKDGWLHD